MAPHSHIQPTESSERERSNWAALSLLRFLLALFISIWHLRLYSNIGPAYWMFELGSFEVVLCFLLISGYSIGHSIARHPTDFLRRRMWRIYPVYLAALLLNYLVLQDPINAAFLGEIFLNLFFLTQILVAGSYLSVSWSLTVEVWLYIFAPLLVRLSARALERLVLLSFLCFILYTCGRSLFHWVGYVTTLYAINLPALGFIWLAGFYLAVSAGDKRRALRLIGLLFTSYLIVNAGIQLVHRLKHGELRLFLPVDSMDYLGNAVLFLALYLAFRAVILRQFHFNFLTRRAFHFLGDISYPLYLVHISVYTYLSRYLSKEYPLVFVLTAIFVATAIYYGCDFYSRQRPVK